MKSFDEVINGNVNEGMTDEWQHDLPILKDPNFHMIGEMLVDIMKRLDEIEAKLPYRRSTDLGPG